MALIDTSGLALYDEEYVQPLMDSIAPTESGATSAHDYAVGQEFYHNNLLYKAKTAIETGDTFVDGTNIEQAQDISTQLFNSVGGHITIDQQTYDSLPDAQKLDPGKFYYIDDAQGADYDNIRDIVAPTEYAAGAAEARAKGDEFIVGDNLLRATQAIAANTPIAIGTNAELAGTIVSQLKALFDGVDNVRANIDNPNLLDNPWFTVNQRGSSSYGGAANTYTVDRWQLSHATLSLAIASDGSISLTNTDGTVNPEFRQRIDNDLAAKLNNKTLTLSVNIGGTIYSGSGVYSYDENETPISIITNLGIRIQLRNIPTATVRCLVRILFETNVTTTISDIRAMKLETGEVSTLGTDIIPNYALEVAKCRASKADTTDTYANQGEINVGTPGPNILNNGWFTINQRAESSYNAAGYCVDRWKMTNANGTLTPSNKGITITAGSSGNFYMQQFIENGRIYFGGKKVTLSILMQDGTVYEAHGIAPSSVPSSGTSNIGQLIQNDIFLATSLYINNTDQMYVQIGVKMSKTAAIRAIKLEVGEISTIKNDIEPNYEEELLKCQRYFERIGGSNYEFFGVGMFQSATNCELSVKVAPKRVAPTITFNGTVYLWDYSNQGANAHTSTTMGSGANCSKDGRAYVHFTTTGGTAGNVAFGQFRDTTSYIDLSADL